MITKNQNICVMTPNFYGKQLDIIADEIKTNIFGRKYIGTKSKCNKCVVYKENPRYVRMNIFPRDEKYNSIFFHPDIPKIIKCWNYDFIFYKYDIPFWLKGIIIDTTIMKDSTKYREIFHHFARLRQFMLDSAIYSIDADWNKDSGFYRLCFSTEHNLFIP